MRPLADLDDYAVEIRVQMPGGGWRKGSGYVIGPCRVLTALHVLVGEDDVLRGAPVSAPSSIEVRAYGDFAERFGLPDIVLERYLQRIRAAAVGGDYLWRAALLIWPKNGALTPRFDIAILEIKPEQALKHIRSASRISCFLPTTDLTCRATGFPEWTAETTQDYDISSPKTVTGKLSFGPPTSRSYHGFTADNTAPLLPAQWKRFSGSAFIDETTNALVGVASAVLPASGNTGLWLTQLADLAEGLEFQEFWNAAGIPRPSRPAAGARSPFNFLIDPLAYLYEFDRLVPTDRVRDIFDPPGIYEAARAPGISLDELLAPPVFLIAGRWIDLPEEMVKRIRHQIAPEFIGIRDGDPVSLKWRYAVDGDPPGRTVARLREEIASSLYVERPRAIASLETLRDSAQGRDWALIISVDKVKEQDVIELCQFLAEFAKFGRSQRPPSLHINIVPGEAKVSPKQIDGIATFINLIRQGSATLCDNLTIIDNIYLDDCEFIDIRYWGESLERHCRTTAQQCRDFLEQTFPTGTYALSDVKDCLRTAGSAR